MLHIIYLFINFFLLLAALIFNFISTHCQLSVTIQCYTVFLSITCMLQIAFYLNLSNNIMRISYICNTLTISADTFDVNQTFKYVNIFVIANLVNCVNSYLTTYCIII